MAEEKPGSGGPRTISDRVLGAAGVMMILAAVYLLLFGGPSDEGGAAAAPPIELLAPGPGAVVGSPVVLEMRVGGTLTPQPGGWGSGGFHLHADVDGRELMPGPRDIRRLEGGRHAWTLPPLEPGVRTVALFWSDASHRAITGSRTPGISITVQ